MNSTVCRAKNPNTCQYHGTGSSSNTRLLRDTMMVARSVYQAASESEKFAAYYNLQDAEEAYYGTDEGRSSLIAHINRESDPTKKQHWLEVLDRADKRREFVENQLASLTTKEPVTYKPKLLFNANMRVETSNGRKYVILADGTYPDGRNYMFDWDQTSGRILYEESGDPDSGRLLGIATDVGTARNICENWYIKNMPDS